MKEYARQRHTGAGLSTHNRWNASSQYW